eukprot:SAG11_NODE_9526_length_903_cov_1.099502_1_plen_60_part_00
MVWLEVEALVKNASVKIVMLLVILHAGDGAIPAVVLPLTSEAATTKLRAWLLTARCCED